MGSEASAPLLHTRAIFEEMRFRVTADVCQLFPPGPERIWRLALLEVVIAAAARRPKQPTHVLHTEQPLDVSQASWH